MTELEFTYTNHRGETAIRKARPLGVRFGTTKWHTVPQLLMRAICAGHGAEREFAVRDMTVPGRSDIALVLIDALPPIDHETRLELMRDHVLRCGISDQHVMKLVSDDAKAVAGGLFAPMIPGQGQVRFAMRESRPTQRTDRALAELVAAGALERRDEENGEVVYLLQLNLSAFSKWMDKNGKRADLRFSIVEPMRSEAEA